MKKVNYAKTNIELFVIYKVKEKRQEIGYSQSELADLMNLSNGFIGKIESPNHSAKYNLNHLNKIAKIFKCSLKDFFPNKPFE